MSTVIRAVANNNSEVVILKDVNVYKELVYFPTPWCLCRSSHLVAKPTSVFPCKLQKTSPFEVPMATDDKNGVG